MTNKQAQITINSIKFMLDHAQYSDDVEEALNMAISALTAKPEQSIAQERYEDLCEYFKDCSDQGRSVLNDRKEFKSWLDRMKWHVMECDKLGRELEKLPPAQPERIQNNAVHLCDSCQYTYVTCPSHGNDAVFGDGKGNDNICACNKYRPISAQPERTCVNCGRTVNNGGWYADGRTRCPIEEHYALPKDGFCHLWEKRNITDDDYPERREE